METGFDREIRKITKELFTILAVAPHEFVSSNAGLHYWFNPDRNHRIIIGYRNQQPIWSTEQYVLFSNKGPCCSWNARTDTWRVYNRDGILAHIIPFVLESFGYVTQLCRVTENPYTPSVSSYAVAVPR